MNKIKLSPYSFLNIACSCCENNHWINVICYAI